MSLPLYSQSSNEPRSLRRWWRKLGRQHRRSTCLLYLLILLFIILLFAFILDPSVVHWFRDLFSTLPYQSDHPIPVPIQKEDWYANRNFAVMIDAGSSGSRVQVYSWKDIGPSDGVISASTLPIVEKGDQTGDRWQHKEEPGISSYGDNPEDVGSHLKPLLDFAASVVPSEKIAYTPVYLKATAGMRLLSESKQMAVLDEACSYIKGSYEFKIDQCNSHVQIISGETEGIYGWIAINYLMGGFESESAASNTFGFLDMGGASTQIAFEPRGEVAKEHANDLSNIKLRKLDGSILEYNVYVTTFLGYGTNEARNRYLDALIEEHPNEHAIEEPCLPIGFRKEYSQYPNVVFEGTGSFSNCLFKSLPLLNKTVECKVEPCLFNGVHTPTLDYSVHQFVGVSEYWYSSHDILGLGGQYDYVEFERRASKFCATTWDEMVEGLEQTNVYAPSVDEERLEKQCFKSAWLVNILHEGLGLPRITDPDGSKVNIEIVEEKKRANFQSIDTVNNFPISWTLGAVLLEGVSGSIHRAPESIATPINNPPKEHPPPTNGTHLPTILKRALLLLSVLGVVFVVYQKVIKKKPLKIPSRHEIINLDSFRPRIFSMTQYRRVDDMEEGRDETMGSMSNPETPLPSNLAMQKPMAADGMTSRNSAVNLVALGIERPSSSLKRRKEIGDTEGMDNKGGPEVSVAIGYHSRNVSSTSLAPSRRNSDTEN
ncbi:hypothetical protein K493DRAFT_314418 [Basidiobolus meristosporus CBS 931.73]|uniref:Nucleoside phosphatase GDA1/CD39 n=1 Tax=Basidiobolus meristosporus CBS 931.73 TaxID=1314790 RepID=A0A1Y1YF43_9FUNG|nr:hypothetical protein K493DRAFT_314418 [Basidiobolus meristosporus CBS 931.73]|eukprot:ORX96619.1 hypothetical protein K493DRAFT_314418 [Basidiobolus meristosporus CBS 931.73]